MCEVRQKLVEHFAVFLWLALKLVKRVVKGQSVIHKGLYRRQESLRLTVAVNILWVCSNVSISHTTYLLLLLDCPSSLAQHDWIKKLLSVVSSLVSGANVVIILVLPSNRLV